jgi:hypothetical protein
MKTDLEKLKEVSQRGFSIEYIIATLPETTLKLLSLIDLYERALDYYEAKHEGSQEIRLKEKNRILEL